MKQKKIIIIAGPTAVGKTEAAINVAEYFNTQIISADSRQCYRELNIGVAKPSRPQLSAVHHYFIDSHSIADYLTAAEFERYALAAAAKIFETGDIAVMCGGTGLYIKAFCEGLDDIPQIKSAVKKTIAQNFKVNGIEWLQQAIAEEDQQFFAAGEMQNPQRMLRALEVKRSTGKSIIEYRTSSKKERDFQIIKFALELPREILYDRINERTNEMMRCGLQEEAYGLLPHKELNALQTVGYRELFDHFENNISLEKAIELIKQNTRHYAKRQMTWFKKDPSFNWLKRESAAKSLIESIPKI